MRLIETFSAALALAFLLISHASAIGEEISDYDDEIFDESKFVDDSFAKKIEFTNEHQKKISAHNATLQEFNAKYRELMEELERQRAIISQQMEQENLEYLKKMAGTDGKTLEDIRGVNAEASTSEAPETTPKSTTSEVITDTTTVRVTTKPPPVAKGEGHPHGKPQVIIHLAPGQPILIDENAVGPLQELSKSLGDYKVAVYSIVGAFRQGKSFLMDYCLRFLYANYKSLNFMNNTLQDKAKWMGASDEPLQGFSWRSGAIATTHGIVMWSDIFLHESETGEKTAIAIMDTQGLFDTNARMQESTKIFALNSLLSSFLIFNMKFQIDEQKLEYLQMVSEYSKLVQEMGNNDKKDYGKPFQNLLFLIRDWAHGDDHALGLEGGNEYVNDVLNPESRPEELAERREHIRATFSNIYGFLLPHPGRKVGGSRQFDGRWSDMEPEFKQTLVKLIEWMLSPANLRPKMILGSALTGREYFAYINAYCDIFQSDSLPDVSNVYDTTIEMHMRVHMARVVEIYESAMKQYEDDFLGDSDVVTIVKGAHEENKAKAIEVFTKIRKMGTEEMQAKYASQLSKEIDDFFERWRTQKLEVRNTFDRLRVQREQLMAELMQNVTKEREALVQMHNQKLGELNQQLTESVSAFNAQRLEWERRTKEFKEENRKLREQLEKLTVEFAAKIEESKRQYEELRMEFEAERERERRERSEKDAEEEKKLALELENLKRQNLENSFLYNQTIDAHRWRMDHEKRRRTTEDRVKNLEHNRLLREQEEAQQRLLQQRAEQAQDFENQMKLLRERFRKEQNERTLLEEKNKFNSELIMKQLLDLQTRQKDELDHVLQEKERHMAELRETIEHQQLEERTRIQMEMEALNKQILLAKKQQQEKEKKTSGGFFNPAKWFNNIGKAITAPFASRK